MTTLLVFDLDGTLIESGPGIFDSLRKTFQETKRSLPTEETLQQFIGPSLLDAFQDYAEVSAQDAPEMVRIFRKHYHREGIYVGTPYLGIAETLDRLQKDSHLAVATAKPQESAETVLEHFGLRNYFDELVGADEAVGRTTKTQILGEAISRFPQVDKSRIWMIGDRRFDLLGAWENQVDFVAALYGYGSKRELQEARYRVTTPPEIADLYAQKMR